jgi:hypothetical protein
VGYVEHPYAGEDLDEVLTAALSRIAERLPGWTPRETHVEYALLSELARLALDTRLLAADVADGVFRSFGTKLVGLPPHPGSPATGSAVFTVTEPGRTVPADTTVLWTDASGTGHLFTTTADTTADAGTLTAEVELVATEPGQAATGLPAGELALVDALAYVTAVAATTPSSGGTDPEQDADYLDRLSQSLQLLRRVPVLAADYAVLARDVPGVHRAVALDGYDPDTDTTGNERTLAVAPFGADGNPVSADVAEALRARIDNEREVNFVVTVIAPSYTPLTVTWHARAALGADPAAVLTAGIAGARAFLSPAAWAGGTERPPVWRPQTVVRFLDLVGVLSRTPGVAELLDVTLNGARADVTLTGPAPLPAPDSTVTGTVDAP